MGEEVGRRWAHDELEAWVAQKRNAKKGGVLDSTPPAHWPAGVRVDKAKWISWLPAGWGQGIKTTASGTEAKAYISPEGKMFYNKADIEKSLGMVLEDAKPTAKQKDADAPPREDWPEWLPLNWLIGARMSAGKPRTCYFSPSGKGLFNRDQVLSFLLKDPSAAAEPKVEAKAAAGRGSRKDKAQEKDKEPAEAKAAGAKSPSKNGASAPSGGPGAADAAKASPAKRPRLEDEGTDNEVEHITEGEPGHCYMIRSCRNGGAWLVLPEDVMSLDLKAIGARVEEGGWTCSASDAKRSTFSGSPGLVLYGSGKLLVRSGKGDEARRIAERFVDKWLE